MKTIFKTLVLILINLNSYSQEIKIPELEEGTRVIVNDKNIVVGGVNFKEHKTNKLAKLICYDLKLNKIWELNLHSKQINSIDTITFWDNRIIISGTEGEKGEEYEKLTRFIKIISSDGKYLSEINIGRSTSKSTDFIIQKTKLYLGYKKTSSINYRDMIKTFKNAVVEVNLTTMKYKIYEHYLPRSTPEFIYSRGENVFICGIQYKNDYNAIETFFHNIKDAKPINNLLPAGKMEMLGSGITTKNGFILASISNQYKNNKYEYLKLDVLNTKGKLQETKNIPYKDLGWIDKSPTFLDIKNEFWFRVTKEDKKSYLVQLNSDGKEISSIEFNGERRVILTMNSKEIIHLSEKNQIVTLKKSYR